MDRARLTVVAPLMTEGGTEAGPPIIWGPRPYRAARGTACWWWTGQGSPSHVCDMGGMEAAEAAAANMGTLWTDLMEKRKNISWKLGIRLFFFSWKHEVSSSQIYEKLWDSSYTYLIIKAFRIF